MNKIKLLSFVAVMLAAFSGNAQVTQMRYGLAYDRSTCRWSVYMKVIAGSATTSGQRVASTGKVTLVVTNSTTVGSTIYANEPKSGLTGTTASGWTQPNAMSFTTGALAGYKIYDYNPNTSNAWYSTLNTGDSVTLFSVDITTEGCGANIRLWNNNVIQGSAVTGAPTDPVSSPYTGGNDYNNGLGIGSATQRYIGNLATSGPPKPTIIASRTVSGASLLLNSTVTPGSACATITDYHWTGPNSYDAYTRNAVVNPLVPASFGTYSITAADNLGCAATVALNAIALPVNISKFGGSAAKCAALLNWETASESNFDRFEVQYSADGKSFMTVGEVASKKQKTGAAYSFTYGQPSGKGFYRLKMIDFGGLTTFGETISVQTSCGNAGGEISITPNPTTGLVHIRGTISGSEVRVIDMLGKVVASEISNGSALSVNLSSYANGVYNVLVSQDGAWEKVGQILKN